MPQPTQLVVIFDMNDVLCRYDLDKRIGALTDYTGKPAHAIRAAIWESGFEDRSDAGYFADADAYLEEFGKRLGFRIAEEQWIAACRAGIAPDQRMIALAKTMKERSRLVLFSNNGWLMKKSLRQVFPEAHAIFGREFYCSCEFHARKPAPIVYSRLVERLGSKADQCFYIDDNAANMEAAVRAGLLGHHFTSYEELLREALAMGLIP
ncbi:MAG TPA: HAD family phosphatase [Aestuariivirgaceae bacterium]|jgi:putative hydrolase of the HAD superfamily